MSTERLAEIEARLNEAASQAARSPGADKGLTVDWYGPSQMLEDFTWLVSALQVARSGTEGATAPPMLDSGTYGELPDEIRPLIHGYEWDNMRRDEQRAWLIAKLAAFSPLGRNPRASSSLGEPTPATRCLKPGNCEYASRGWCPKCEPITTPTLAQVYGQFPGATTGEPTRVSILSGGPFVRQFTLCHLSGERAVDGACRIHHGDACLMEYCAAESIGEPARSTDEGSEHG